MAFRWAEEFSWDVLSFSSWGACATVQYIASICVPSVGHFFSTLRSTALNKIVSTLVSSAVYFCSILSYFLF